MNSGNNSNITNVINKHPFCNLTTNTEIDNEKHTESFHYYIPITWLIFRVFFLLIFSCLTLLILKEIILYILYQHIPKKNLESIELNVTKKKSRIQNPLNIKTKKKNPLNITVANRNTWFNNDKTLNKK